MVESTTLVLTNTEQTFPSGGSCPSSARPQQNGAGTGLLSPIGLRIAV